MDTITIFTTYLERDSVLFGTGEQRINRKAVVSEDLVKLLEEIFHLNKRIKDVWDSLTKENKQRAFVEYGKDAKHASQWVMKTESDNELLNSIWKNQKTFIITHSYAAIYKAPNFDGVYALQALRERDQKDISTWVKDLVRISKALIPSKKININLVLHDKDVKRDDYIPFYVYKDSELCNVFGDEDKFNEYKKSNEIEKLKVILFQHDSPEASHLLNNKELKDVHGEVERCDKSFYDKLCSTIDEMNANT